MSDLIERLRHKTAVVPSDNTLCDEAADRLEQVERELAEALGLLTSATNESLLDYEVWRDWKARRDALLTTAAKSSAEGERYAEHVKMEQEARRDK